MISGGLAGEKNLNERHVQQERLKGDEVTHYDIAQVALGSQLFRNFSKKSLNRLTIRNISERFSESLPGLYKSTSLHTIPDFFPAWLRLETSANKQDF